jgi:PhnB protein
MLVQNYLFFDGRCEEALDFYRRALGAKDVSIMRYGDAPMPPEHIPPHSGHKVIHASFKIGATEVMASDGHCRGHPEFKGFALSIAVDSEAAAKRTFAALEDGGKVDMPLGKTFFSSAFGMVTDRFGVQWMVIVPQS